jgi:hypothetical protein
MHAIEIPLLICWRHAGLITKCAGALPALAKKMMVLSLTIGIRGTRRSSISSTLCYQRRQPLMRRQRD